MRSKEREVPRRDFMQTAAMAGAAFGSFTILGATAKGAGRTFKVGLIGCGGRGNGALGQHLTAARMLNDKLGVGLNLKVVGTADYFKDKAERAGKKHGLRARACFGGANGYKRLLALKPDIIVTATPPLFRPVHVEAAIEAGCHVFMEKPVGVDPPGCRRVIQAGELAKTKGLMVVAGTQRRHTKGFLDTYQAVVVEKALGKLYAGRVGWCSRHAFNKAPVKPRTVDDYVRSWKVWIGLSGDHIVEQHVHNLDVANWFVGRHPVSAVGMGGRARRPAGNMYDFFSIDFDYGDGEHIHSMCRQVNDCWRWVNQEFVYEKGTTSGNRGPRPRKSTIPTDMPLALKGRGKRKGNVGHQQEHVNMLYHLARGRIHYNEARSVAESTAAAVMGRTACYTGQQISWHDMMADPSKKPELYNLTLRPTAEDFETGSVQIPKEGVAPVPGKRA